MTRFGFESGGIGWGLAPLSLPSKNGWIPCMHCDRSSQGTSKFTTVFPLTVAVLALVAKLQINPPFFHRGHANSVDSVPQQVESTVMENQTETTDYNNSNKWWSLRPFFASPIPKQLRLLFHFLQILTKFIESPKTLVAYQPSSILYICKSSKHHDCLEVFLFAASNCLIWKWR